MSQTKIEPKIEQWSLDKLNPYDHNPRTHSAEQVAQIQTSILEFGFCNPILVDSHGVIIAGHGRFEAAQALALQTVPVMVLGHLTPDQAQAFRIADNKIALNGGWDEDLLAAELSSLEALDFDLPVLGFDTGELDALIPDYQPPQFQPSEQGAFQDDQDTQAAGAMNTMVQVGEFRFKLDAETYEDWLTDLRAEVGLEESAIIAAIRQRLGVHAAG